ncbi:nucleotidyltransferase family protein [Paracoccus sp. (in: a-proteobacteria)]|uniref:nucleotidyltransferase family protein n=1 Tax=Paracoccus sp. TaxID=267 RepID=UPI0026DEC97E|nr:nucleotidyltransferase family protein [Paracoccus sp. (in: a-proteobacteria)]MDO5370718.1 nucleotidyltransferase family protein [Paracoccus sp. (in: a-proteobacteria)]
MTAPEIAGILLAAGHGRRFGAGNKLLADWRGAPVVVHAADALRQAGAAQLIAVLRDRRVAALLPGFRVVMADSAETMSDSLRLGLAAAQGDRALIALGDMPAVPPAHLAALIRACTPYRAAASAYPAPEGPRAGVPACLPRSLFAAAARIKGDQGARHLLTGARLIPLPPGAGHDIDRPKDLVRPQGH